MNEQNNPEAVKKSFFTKKKIVISIFAVFFIIVSVVGVSFAMKANHYKNSLRDGGPLMMMLNKMTEDLNLTPKQQAEVNQIKEDIKAKHQANKDKRKNAADEFESLFRQDNLDKQTLESIAERHDADRKEMRTFMIEQTVRFHSILTSEQRNKVADKMKDMRDRFKRGDFKKPFDKE